MRRLVRGYTKTAAMAAAARMGDNSLFLIDYLVRLLRVLLFFSIWRTLLGGKGSVSGFTLERTLTYTLIAEAFHDLLNCRTWLESSFWDGTIATRFLRPISVFGQFAAEWAGLAAFNLCAFSLPLFLCASWMGIPILPASIASGGLFLVSLFLAVCVGLSLEYVFSGLAVTMGVHPYVFNGMRVAVGTLLSGSFMPLALLPFGLGRVFAWLPFASQASAPLSLFTGSTEVATLLGLQLFWAVALWAVATWLWGRSRERMVAYGG